MTSEKLQILLERAKDTIKYAQPQDETQWAYNEGIEDLALAIELENLINNKNK